ncbi:MAG TPA: chemotaxis protein CheB [Anaerolineae bacterium]|nr:chemotaxis protein CheB [Anaerolineae bacterium]
MAKKKSSPKNPSPPVPEVNLDSHNALAEPPVPPDQGLIIVGIGASAGGQEAFEKFFAHMPGDSGLAFVVVQHLDPTHKSILVELLQRYTPLQVWQVQDGMRVEPNCVYVIPPNRNLAMLHGTLYLLERAASRGLHLPIDSFFRSLAQDQGDKAVGIILSGTGSDGTLGLTAIKGEGGLTMVQDPASAGYDGMPRSAIATGLVDFVLPPEQLPGQLLAYLKQPYVQTPAAIPSLAAPAVDWLHKIYILLRSRSGHDFSLYKQKTVARRIERRMALQQIERIEEYYRYLQQTPAEVDTLFKELLIGVTNFFRDPAAFAALEQEVIPRLFEQREPGDSLRVWAPGCATGEEAYSLAILLREYMDTLKREFKVQLFATDINAGAIEQARQGRYSLSIAADVSPERLQRFFLQGEEAYQVGEQIRGMVVFAVQSVIKDPPFSKVDLISCRNLLIYLDPALQKKVVSLFHYALNPGGFLFLGTSESTDEFPHLFSPVNRRWKLFQRAANGIGLRPSFVVPVLPWVSEESAPVVAAADKRVSLRDLVAKMLLEQAPAGVVVNAEGDILYVHGRTGKYLELVGGEGVSSNIFRLAREGLRVPLASALHQAAAAKEAVTYAGIQVKTNGEMQTLNLTVKLLPETGGTRELMLVQFHQVEPNLKPAAPAVTEAGRVAELEHELQALREYLQATIEELEAANEELKSTNEEMQSANEELESSREELQSLNEELVTLNSEHEQKIARLTQVNNDLTNVLTRIDVGIIFLDSRLRIRRFNPAATRISNLIEGDIGRPIGHIVSNLRYEHLVQAAQDVLNSLAPREAEVQSRDGRWYFMRIRPYRTVDNVIEGVMLTFNDITEQKEVQTQLSQAQATVQVARDLAENIVNMVRDPLMVLAGDLRVVSANLAFYAAFQTTPEETVGQLIYDLGQGQWDNPKLRELLEEIIPQRKSLENFELEFNFPAGGPKRLRFNARQIEPVEGQPALILLVIEEMPGRNKI